MSIYTQKANILMEQLPVTDQRFIFEFIVSYKRNNDLKSREQLPNKKISNTKKAIRDFINGINAVTDEPLDEEFDEIVRDRINITRELDL